MNTQMNIEIEITELDYTVYVNNSVSAIHHLADEYLRKEIPDLPSPSQEGHILLFNQIDLKEHGYSIRREATPAEKIRAELLQDEEFDILDAQDLAFCIKFLDRDYTRKKVYTYEYFYERLRHAITMRTCPTTISDRRMKVVKLFGIMPKVLHIFQYSYSKAHGHYTFRPMCLIYLDKTNHLAAHYYEVSP